MRLSPAASPLRTFTNLAMRNTVSNLTEHWQWRELTTDENIQEAVANVDSSANWRNTIQFPSEVHVELKAVGLIPDPNIGFNEHKVQCMYYLSS